MIIGIKVFHGVQLTTMQEQIDYWLKEEKPTEVTSMTASESVGSERDGDMWVNRALYVAYKK